MKQITLLLTMLVISLVSISQTIHDFDAATNGIPTGEYAIYKGVKEPVYATTKGKKFIKTVTKDGKPSKKYIPVTKPVTAFTIPVRAMTVRNKALSIRYNIN